MEAVEHGFEILGLKTGSVTSQDQGLVEGYLSFFSIPKMAMFKGSYLFQTIILGIHVSFLGCKQFSFLHSMKYQYPVP